MQGCPVQCCGGGGSECRAFWAPISEGGMLFTIKKKKRNRSDALRATNRDGGQNHHSVE